MTNITQFMRIRSMLIGTLLGDAHIRRNKLTSYITFEQSLAKASYLLHLYRLVKDQGFDMNPPVQYNRVDPRYPLTPTSSLYFRTLAHPVFNLLSDLFTNRSGQKKIPVNIADYLDIVVLAY